MNAAKHSMLDNEYYKAAIMISLVKAALDDTNVVLVPESKIKVPPIGSTNQSKAKAIDMDHHSTNVFFLVHIVSAVLE